MKVNKLDFYYRYLCILNIVNQLLIRIAPDPSIFHEIHPLSAISTTGKKGEKRAEIQKLPRCIPIVDKIN